MLSGRWMVPVVKLLQDASCKCPNTCACTATLTSTPPRPINLTIYPCPKSNVLTHPIFYSSKTKKRGKQMA
ncbi:hypothetical protein GGI42DRAFT_324852 [Trichoderma sp. SZMC 28013]